MTRRRQHSAGTLAGTSRRQASERGAERGPTARAGSGSIHRFAHARHHTVAVTGASTITYAAGVPTEAELRLCGEVTGRRVIASNVSAPTKRVAECVMTATTS